MKGWTICPVTVHSYTPTEQPRDTEMFDLYLNLIPKCWSKLSSAEARCDTNTGSAPQWSRTAGSRSGWSEIWSNHWGWRNPPETQQVIAGQPDDNWTFLSVSSPPIPRRFSVKFGVMCDVTLLSDIKATSGLNIHLRTNHYDTLAWLAWHSAVRAMVMVGWCWDGSLNTTELVLSSLHHLALSVKTKINRIFTKK